MSLRFDQLSDQVCEQINSALASKKLNKIVVGYSGGLDSTVLTHIVAGLKHQLQSIVIIHVNHGVDPDANQWAQHCRSFCEKLSLELKVVNYSLGHIKTDREAKYRQARYRAFADELSEDGLLLTAHHRRDQVETVLFNLFRGGGVSGLRGMKSLRDFGRGFHLRPMLLIPQKVLADYAGNYNLSWIDDPSNQDQELDRNYIRHQLLPAIENRWPSAQSSIARSADLLVQSENVLNEIVEQDIVQIEAVDFPSVIKNQYLSVLNKKHLQAYSVQRQRHALRYWLNRLTSIIPNSYQIDQIIQDLCGTDKKSGLFSLGDYEIRCYKDFLYLMPKLNQVPQRLGSPQRTDDQTYFFKDIFLQLRFAQKVPEKLSFKLREDGDRVTIDGQTKRLKKLYQDYEIPPWERAVLPLIYEDDRFIAFAGMNINPGFSCTVMKVNSENSD